VNLLVVGVSHHTAPVDLLERLSVGSNETGAVLVALAAQDHVREAVLLSTCNRVEVYAAVTGFHGGLAEIGAVLGERAGLSVTDLATHLYLHYGTDAARHAFRVAAGLDSMVVGEGQILGQLREAYQVASDRESTGRVLHELMQQALRVGKRVHAETGIDRAGQSLVTAALAAGERALGRLEGDQPGASAESRRSVLILGAGAMGALALATLKRTGAGSHYVANRGADRARRLAELHGATAVDIADLGSVLSTVDTVISATASPEPVLTADAVAAAAARRGPGRPLLLLDLAVPRDIEPAAGDLPGVVLIDLDRLGQVLASQPSEVERAAAEEIVAAEVETFLGWLRGADVAPTVAALRARADEVVAAELRRLSQRRPDLSEDQRAEVAHAVHRVVQRLLHSPTVRVRERATTPDGDQYAAVLRELFDLDLPGDDLSRAVEIDAGEPR
jgi:glutamyl-tRNA reductase